MSETSKHAVPTFHRLHWLVALAATTAALMAPAAIAASSTCHLKSARGDIEHVIYIQFDNTHFLRDNANVPSDLEQMPHLLNFIKDNGTLLTNDHTVLISHTAGGILSSLTGVYPDRHGQIVSNSNVRISNTGTFSFPSSFGYWTDPVAATTTIPNMVTPDGLNAPAPWVPYTRAGCDVGAVATANIVLENTGTGPSGDMTKVFGAGSPQYIEAAASNAAPSGTAARARAQTDFVGFAIHCAQGSPACGDGQADLLPQEPGSYIGFKGLFGAQAINTLLTGQLAPIALTDLLGAPITDPFGQPGFPGFDGMSAAVSLAYVAAMQAHGIPITYAYISDAHDNHGTSGNIHVAYGPGDAGYVQQLQAYDKAFAVFFERLAAVGIDKSNTLFVFTVDEGDHFVGVTKTGCDGVTIPCIYGVNEVGEISVNIDTLVADQFPSLAAQFLGAAAPNAFTVHGDDAPTFYLAKKGAGALGQSDPLTRAFERNIANLTAVNLYTSSSDRVMVQMADQIGMKALHMFTAGDPARNATFVLFGNPDYFITDFFPAGSCQNCINPAFAWNHGDIQTEIASTWLGLVGPGVRAIGTSGPWTDHTDVRPTILTLLGLQDAYVHDGRTLIEPLYDWAVPQSLRAHRETLLRLGAVYKQLNAAFGQFAMDALAASTRALRSGSASDDTGYTAIESNILDMTTQRDTLAVQMKALLDAAAFSGQAINEQQAKQLIAQGETLLQIADGLAGQ